MKEIYVEDRLVHFLKFRLNNNTAMECDSAVISKKPGWLTRGHECDLRTNRQEQEPEGALWKTKLM